MRTPDADEPLNVHIVVYDLLPPGRLSKVLNLFGSGVYHSSVQLTLPSGPNDRKPKPIEYAFGGHTVPGTTGIFSIPAGSAAERMPGLRYYMSIDCEECFGESWKKAFKRKTDRRKSHHNYPPLPHRSQSYVSEPEGQNTNETPSPEWGWKPRSPSIAGDSVYSSVPATSSSQLNSPFPLMKVAPNPVTDFESKKMSMNDDWNNIMMEDGLEGTEEEEDDGDDLGVSDGTYYMTKAQRKARRIIEEMKKDPQWHGTRYQLLEKNCNTFTHELLWRLTGRKGPLWLNRAAWIATSLPCIVPPGWIDESGDQIITAETQTVTPIILAPPRADHQMLSTR